MLWRDFCTSMNLLLVFWHLFVIVILISAHEKRFSRIGNQSCFTITTPLLGAHPIFAICFEFCTNVRITIINNFPGTSLSSHIIKRLRMFSIIHANLFVAVLFRCPLRLVVKLISCKKSKYESVKRISIQNQAHLIQSNSLS